MISDFLSTKLSLMRPEWTDECFTTWLWWVFCLSAIRPRLCTLVICPNFVMHAHFPRKCSHKYIFRTGKICSFESIAQAGFVLGCFIYRCLVKNWKGLLNPYCFFSKKNRCVIYIVLNSTSCCSIHHSRCSSSTILQGVFVSEHRWQKGRIILHTTRIHLVVKQVENKNARQTWLSYKD